MPPPRHPVRIAHLGLGAFARSHQAWYTQVANDAHADRSLSPSKGGWGIIASASRVTPELTKQDFRYGMITRRPQDDEVHQIDSVVAVGTSLSEGILDRYPEIAVLTVTVTEAGYLAGAKAITQIVEGLDRRRRLGGGPLAIVPCDNVPSNGTVLRDTVLAVADADFGRWILDNVSFVTTMVDRITPAATESDRAIASEALGWHDAVPVVTEPFTEWVLQGEFPAGRPDWELAGARFVDDVEPYEQRKLWMLNAAHSLMAYRGLERGHATVFDAFADPVLASEVEQLWEEARPVLTMDATELDSWIRSLRIRWRNPRIEHRLEQIAQGGEQKIPARIGAVIRRREEAGLAPGTAELEAVAAWERYRASR